MTVASDDANNVVEEVLARYGGNEDDDSVPTVTVDPTSGELWELLPQLLDGGTRDLLEEVRAAN